MVLRIIQRTIRKQNVKSVAKFLFEIRTTPNQSSSVAAFALRRCRHDSTNRQTSKRQDWIFQCYSSISLGPSSHLCTVDDRSWLWLSSVKSTFASWSAVGDLIGENTYFVIDGRAVIGRCGCSQRGDRGRWGQYVDGSLANVNLRRFYFDPIGTVILRDRGPRKAWKISDMKDQREKRESICGRKWKGNKSISNEWLMENEDMVSTCID